MAHISDASQQAAADAVVDDIDVGTTNSTGKLRIYDDSASQPADPDDAVPSGSVLLVEYNLQDPAYGSADTTGTAVLQGTTLSTTASNGGTMLWFRVVDKDEVAIFDGTITESGGGGDLIASNLNVNSGQTVELDSLDYTQAGT